MPRDQNPQRVICFQKMSNCDNFREMYDLQITGSLPIMWNSTLFWQILCSNNLVNGFKLNTFVSRLFDIVCPWI